MNNNRRKFILQSATLGLAALFPFKTNAKNKEVSPPLPSLKGKKILFTYGGWNGHEPTKFAEYLTPWMKEEGAEVLLHSTLDVYTDKAVMDTIDLVVQIFTMSTITKEQEKGLLACIKNGAGMAGWHGGMCDAFRNNTNYQYMTGGQWVAHPGGVIDYDVNFINQEDEVSKGLKNFSVKSEQYYMHVDPNVKVLATTRFSDEHNQWIEGATMPVVWKKSYDKGRIFYTSLGHNLNHVIDIPEGMEIIKRGIQWASASKYEPMEKWMSPKY